MAETYGNNAGSVETDARGARVFGGRLEAITCCGEIPDRVSVKGNSLSFVVFDEAEIPRNTITSERKRVEGWSRSIYHSLAAWSFRAAGFSFLLSNDRLQIRVVSQEEILPDFLVERVLETLFFVLGRPLYPTIT